MGKSAAQMSTAILNAGGGSALVAAFSGVEVAVNAPVSSALDVFEAVLVAAGVEDMSGQSAEEL